MLKTSSLNIFFGSIFFSIIFFIPTHVDVMDRILYNKTIIIYLIHSYELYNTLQTGRTYLNIYIVSCKELCYYKCRYLTAGLKSTIRILSRLCLRKETDIIMITIVLVLTALTTLASTDRGK